MLYYLYSDAWNMQCWINWDNQKLFKMWCNQLLWSIEMCMYMKKVGYICRVFYQVYEYGKLECKRCTKDL